MTFLEKYGLGAVSLTMLVTALSMECNIILESLFNGSRKISMDTFIDAEFSAATLLISFGALIGRASPLQISIIAIAEAIFYTANKVFIVVGWLNAEDVGGSITIHMFGAYFGLACAYAIGPQEKESASNNSASRVSDVLSLIGTTLLVRDIIVLERRSSMSTTFSMFLPFLVFVSFIIVGVLAFFCECY